MSLKVPSALVTADWLFENLNHEDLLVLNGTIPKVSGEKSNDFEDIQIKNSLFFDIKNTFSDTEAPFPNTAVEAKTFQEKAQQLGVNQNSCIVVYDDFGVYSSPRVWWLFQLMGFTNIAVLNGGLPEWISKGYPTEKKKTRTLPKGDFIANYKPTKISFTEDVLDNISTKKALVIDACSQGRFNATEPEPRKEMKGGRIPNSKNLPHSKIVKNAFLESVKNLNEIYTALNPNKLPLIFSCGSGITASVLALGVYVAGHENYSVYDGSWTEWASTPNLPIEK